MLGLKNLLELKMFTFNEGVLLKSVAVNFPFSYVFLYLCDPMVKVADIATAVIFAVALSIFSVGFVWLLVTTTESLFKTRGPFSKRLPMCGALLAFLFAIADTKNGATGFFAYFPTFCEWMSFVPIFCFVFCALEKYDILSTQKAIDEIEKKRKQ